MNIDQSDHRPENPDKSMWAALGTSTLVIAIMTIWILTTK